MIINNLIIRVCLSPVVDIPPTCDRYVSMKYRLTLGPQLVDILTDYSPVVNRFSTDYRLTVDRLSTECWPINRLPINRLSTDISTNISDKTVNMIHKFFANCLTAVCYFLVWCLLGSIICGNSLLNIQGFHSPS